MLCMIDGFGKINEATTALAAALHHGHPGLRENSLRLAEGSTNPEIIDFDFPGFI